jgi:CrcB protein
MLKILVVAAAGAFGALSRWGLSHATQSVLGKNWPYGTLLVNLIGCFVFGLAFEAFVRNRVPDDSPWRLLVLTGFCGAFTTYSTFAFETYRLAFDRRLLAAAANLLLHVVLGLAAVVAGIAAARAIY